MGVTHPVTCQQGIQDSSPDCGSYSPVLMPWVIRAGAQGTGPRAASPQWKLGAFQKEQAWQPTGIAMESPNMYVAPARGYDSSLN